LRAAAGRAIPSVATQVTGMADKVAAIEKGAVSGNLNDAYKAAVVPLCSKMIANRYPMVADSGSDVTLDDFGRLFSGGGVMDSFFNANLAQYVDMSGRTWKAQGGLSISPGALEQFRIARLFRDSMFASGNTPSARFEITPMSLDNAATQVLLEFGGQSVTYNHGPQVPVQMQWPGPGPSGARLTFQQPGAPEATVSKQGPWALFRLFDEGQIAPGGDTFMITFIVGNHSATFQVRPGSAFNPFSLNELHKFRCPGNI